MDDRQRQTFFQDRNRCLNYVNTCQLETPEEVAQLFEDFTRTLWDFKLVGRIHDFYCDNITINREGGHDIVGSEGVLRNTLHLMSAFPDLKLKFIDIFAEGDPEHGYSFGQAIYFDGTNTGYSDFGPPTGKSLCEKDLCLGLCECRVEKVDGRWKIVEEWVTRSEELINATMTMSKEEDMQESLQMEEAVC